MKKITILLASVLTLTSCQWEESVVPPQALWKSVRVNKDTITTTLEQTSVPDTATQLLTPLWPVPIVSVTKVNADGYKWEVTSENGVVFYTNKKYKVGDVAFYMDGDSERLYWTKK